MRKIFNFIKNNIGKIIIVIVVVSVNLARKKLGLQIVKVLCLRCFR